MADVYRIVAMDGRDECYLFCSETPYQAGLYVASVLYWRRSQDVSDMAVEHFTSPKNLTEAKDKAEGWIKRNRFQQFRETQLREA